MSVSVFPLLAAGFSLGLLGASQTNPATFLVWNASESVPIGLYRLQRMDTLSVGDLVAVNLPDDVAAWVVERGYVGADTLLLKRIAAVSSTSVCRGDLAISIADTVVAHAAATDRNGRPLPVWSGCHTLGAEEVFLLNAGVAASFDGRYFGPVTANAVVGRAVPIWTRGEAHDA